MSLIDDIKSGAEGLLNNEQVKDAINKGKEFINSEKGKETLANAKDKVEEFVHDKTNGKGIFGFGKDEATTAAKPATTATAAPATKPAAAHATGESTATTLGNNIGAAIKNMKSNAADK